MTKDLIIHSPPGLTELFTYYLAENCHRICLLDFILIRLKSEVNQLTIKQRMAENSPIHLLAEIAEERHLNVEKIKAKKVPAKVRTTLAKWLRGAKIPATALKKKILCASYAKDKKQYYVFAFQVTKPKAYQGKVIVQGNAILGESSNRPVAPVRSSARPKPKPKIVTVSKAPPAIPSSPQVIAG